MLFRSIGMGKNFRGVYHIIKDEVLLFTPGNERADQEVEVIKGIDNPRLQEMFPIEMEQLRMEVELVHGASHPFSLEDFLSGVQTPVFFGSAINNFGVREILNTLVELAPPPGSRKALQREVSPAENKFSAVVFKIQANMDPAHRDRVAFLRICSGHFQRGMKLKICRNGKEVRTNNALSFLSQRRDILDEAFPGDIIGLPNHGLLRLGDTLTEGEQLQFTGLP